MYDEDKQIEDESQQDCHYLVLLLPVDGIAFPLKKQVHNLDFNIPSYH